MSEHISTDPLRTDNPGFSPFDTFEVPMSQFVLEPLTPENTSPAATIDTKPQPVTEPEAAAKPAAAAEVEPEVEVDTVAVAEPVASEAELQAVTAVEVQAVTELEPVAEIEAKMAVEAEVVAEPVTETPPVAAEAVMVVESEASVEPVAELTVETIVEVAAVEPVAEVEPVAVVEAIAAAVSAVEPVAATPPVAPAAEAKPAAETPPVAAVAATEPMVAAVAPAPATPPTAVIKPAAKAAPPAAEVEQVHSFRNLSLTAEVQQAVQSSGYEIPTEIQAEIIPHMLAGRDVLAQSQTGTGKTAAFALPILSRIEIGQRRPQVLVLAPTRELAIQVAESFSTYAANISGFAIAAIYGGTDYEPQLRQLRRGAQVVVGTPGRVIDHIKRGTLDLSGIECLVLDEADEMLNMGFLDDVQFVLEQTPAERQVALFSATLPAPIRSIAQQYLTDPARITIKKKTMTAESIRQRALFIAPRDKIDVLTRILEAEETDGVIVFTKTREATVTVADQLNRHGLSAVALNGDMPQKVRERTISQLKSGQLDILVATDVAARGLDVSRVSHVFNYDLPQDSESYIHRIGRTGRAGRKGEAIIFLTNGQRHKLQLIERTTKQPIEVVQPPTADDINAMRMVRFKQRISDMTTSQDLTVFQQLISEYATESGQPLDVIAAALAQIGQAGRPFLMTERRRRSEPFRDQQQNPRGGHGHFERNDSGKSSDRPRRSERSSGRQAGPPQRGMDRYRIEVGHDDGVKPGNIVGAVANEGGIDGEHIGPINIHDSYSTIDLPEGMPRDVFQTLQQTRVAGKLLRLSRAAAEHGNAAPRQGQAHRGGAGRPGKPPRRQGSGGKTFAGGKHKKRKPSRPRP